jgi:hypothetical protein
MRNPDQDRDCICDAQKGGPEYMAPGDWHRADCPAFDSPSGFRVDKPGGDHWLLHGPGGRVRELLRFHHGADRPPLFRWTAPGVIIRVDLAHIAIAAIQHVEISDESKQIAVFAPVPDLEWQSIASAPRDGTRVDLWVVGDDGAGERWPDAYWGGSVDTSSPFGFVYRDEGWRDDSVAVEQHGARAVAWRPVPPPPRRELWA